MNPDFINNNFNTNTVEITNKEFKMPNMKTNHIEPVFITNNNIATNEEISDLQTKIYSSDVKDKFDKFESNEILIFIFAEDCMTYLSKELEKDILRLRYNIKCFIVFTSQIKEYIYLIQKPNIYFLFTCMFKVNTPLPKNKYIIYQLEQNTNNKISHYYANYDYITIFKNALYVLDYSSVNMKTLKTLDIKTQYLPIPYHIGNRHIRHIEKKYDILFIGCINERRLKILKAMSNKYNVYIPNIPIYGLDLMNLMNQCKILVNIHFYENAILEIPRINEALNTDIRIISEKDIVQGPDITDLYDGLVTFIENIVEDYTELFEAVDAVLSGENAVDNSRIEKLCRVEDNYNECFGKWINDFQNFHMSNSMNVLPDKNVEDINLYKKIAVITANIGGYDKDLTDISKIINKDFFDWYYFTDSFITSMDWNIIENKTIEKNIKKTFGYKAMMNAKYYKVQPFHIEILKKYEYIIWIDGSIELINLNFVEDIIRKIISTPLEKDILLFEHYIRENIWDEYTLSCNIPKYSDCDMLIQVEKYMNDIGYMKSNPIMYECGTIIYKACPSIYNLCDNWWEEINKYGFQDQLSFPYVLYKNGIIPELLNEENFIKGSLELKGSVWNNKLFGYVRNHV